MNATLHPDDCGDCIDLLHQQLEERGALPPEAAAEVASHTFGPVTAGAVATFQAKHGLQADGIVGPRTWDALAVGVDTEAPPASLMDDAGDATPIARVALAQLLQLVTAGVAEDPLGSNRGPMVDRILTGVDGRGGALRCMRRYAGLPCLYCGGRDAPTPQCQGAPWCGRTVRYAFDLATQQLGGAPPLPGWGDLASAVKWREQALSRRALAEHAHPGFVGLIIVPAQAGRAAHGHVVLVATHEDIDGYVWCLEGNSGNRCASRRRHVSEFTGGFVAV